MQSQLRKDKTLLIYGLACINMFISFNAINFIMKHKISNNVCYLIDCIDLLCKCLLTLAQSRGHIYHVHYTFYLKSIMHSEIIIILLIYNRC